MGVMRFYLEIRGSHVEKREIPSMRGGIRPRSQGGPITLDMLPEGKAMHLKDQDPYMRKVRALQNLSTMRGAYADDIRTKIHLHHSNLTFKPSNMTWYSLINGTRYRRNNSGHHHPIFIAVCSLRLRQLQLPRLLQFIFP